MRDACSKSALVQNGNSFFTVCTLLAQDLLIQDSSKVGLDLFYKLLQTPSVHFVSNILFNHFNLKNIFNLILSKVLWSFTGLAEFSLLADNVGALYKGASAVVHS